MQRLTMAKKQADALSGLMDNLAGIDSSKFKQPKALKDMKVAPPSTVPVVGSPNGVQAIPASRAYKAPEPYSQPVETRMPPPGPTVKKPEPFSQDMASRSSSATSLKDMDPFAAGQLDALTSGIKAKPR